VKSSGDKSNGSNPLDHKRSASEQDKKEPSNNYHFGGGKEVDKNNIHKKQPSTPLVNPPKNVVTSDIKTKQPTEDKTPPKIEKKAEPMPKPSDFLKKQQSEEIKGGIINVNMSDNKKKDQKAINEFMANKLEQKKYSQI
jgi:hypothetical protein